MIKTKTRQTQAERLLYALKQGKTVSRLNAMYDLGIANLTAAVADLRKQGYKIQTIRVKTSNKYGEKTSYAKYKLDDEINEALDVLFDSAKKPETIMQKILNFINDLI